jgi:hypothetical protein
MAAFAAVEVVRGTEMGMNNLKQWRGTATRY